LFVLRATSSQRAVLYRHQLIRMRTSVTVVEHFNAVLLEIHWWMSSVLRLIWKDHSELSLRLPNVASTVLIQLWETTS